jgi:tetratricopeptide (TPR) repeat protein
VIDELIGRGGMGAVYRAHRADGQFEQQVAIKVIDLLLGRGFFRERFRQERQILANLQHPYIAHLLDGGVSEAGDLYLVMEYVDGAPILRFCEQSQMEPRQRAELFLKVCDAVQFAHQNFVVHRDLKPDNILIAADGTPRLLDFGTAKLIAEDHAGAAGGELTREGYLSFTPQYASPEQVKGEPITAATDTYSLGVLLYRLMTGAPPYEIQTATTAELIRVICTEPPRRPAQAAGGHKRFDADLEAILLKVLRKDPLERYGTVEQLATELRAWLKGRPVQARKGTLRYRATKFAQRNRLAISAAVLVLASVLAGIAGVLWQAHLTRQEARMAEARSADLRQLSNSLLSELNEAIKELPGSTGAQKLLVTRVLEHLDRMGHDRSGDRQTQLDLVEAYTQLGEIQGDPYVQNLGDPEGALASFAKALGITEALLKTHPQDAEALRAYALVQQYRSAVLFGDDRTAEALPPMRAATGAWDKLLAMGRETTALLGDAGSAYASLGDELGQAGTSSLAANHEAQDAYRKAMAVDEKALQIDPGFLRAKRGILISRMKIGSILLETDPASAAREFRSGLERWNLLSAKEQEGLSMQRLHSMLLRKTAIAEAAMGENAPAAEHFAEAMRLVRGMAEKDPNDQRAQFDVVVVLDDGMEAVLDAGDPELGATAVEQQRALQDAASKLRESIRILDRILKQDPHHDAWRAMRDYDAIVLSRLHAHTHLGAGAEPQIRAALMELKALAASPQASITVMGYGVNAFLREAPASLRDPAFAMQLAEREVQQSHGRIPSALLDEARACRAMGQLEKSRRFAAQGLALLPEPRPGDSKAILRRRLEALAR